jgi:hypothetical protein
MSATRFDRSATDSLAGTADIVNHSQRRPGSPWPALFFWWDRLRLAGSFGDCSPRLASGSLAYPWSSTGEHLASTYMVPIQHLSDS